MKKMHVVVVSAVAIVAGLGTFSPVFAYGEQIASSFDRIIDWGTKVLGGAVFVGGIAWTGIRLAAHDPEALKNGMWVVVGGLLIFLAKPILALIQGFTGG